MHLVQNGSKMWSIFLQCFCVKVHLKPIKHSSSNPIYCFLFPSRSVTAGVCNSCHRLTKESILPISRLINLSNFFTCRSNPDLDK